MAEAELGPERIIFTIGRMNPPTIGHLLLIKELMEEKAKEGGPGNVYIILSRTLNKKNPLPCETKKGLIEGEGEIRGMITRIQEENPELANINVVIQCMEMHTMGPLPQEQQHFQDCLQISNPILKQICKIRVDNPETTNMLLVVGEDKGNTFDWLKPILENAIPSIHLDIKHLARPQGAMSATLVRKTVTDRNWPAFQAMYSNSGLSEQRVAYLYQQLSEQLPPPAPSPTKRKRDEETGTRQKRRIGGTKKRRGKKRGTKKRRGKKRGTKKRRRRSKRRRIKNVFKYFYVNAYI
jgi:hypothetical protein